MERSAPLGRTAWRSKLSELFGCDLRSLALLRIGLGTAVILDALSRAFDLRLLYTDAGVLPRSLLAASQGQEVLLSAHYWASASVGLQAGLFALTVAAGAALIAGWCTWLATLACWYLIASIQIRQPLVYMGGDSMLRLLLFWSLFLPLGGRFSLDARRRPMPGVPAHVFSAATVAVLLQVCLMYWATGIRKDGPLWWSGRAIYYALHQDLATPLGTWLLDTPAVLVLLNYGTLALEFLGPFLAFVPLATPWFRMATVAVFWLFHLGLASTMHIGLFPVFSMVGWLAFLPARFWELAGVEAHGEARRDPTWRSRLASIAAGLCLVYVVLLLAERARVVPRVLPSIVVQAGRALRLQQTWNMFAPDPSTVIAAFTLRRTGNNGVTDDMPAGTSFRSRQFVRNAVRHRNDGDTIGDSLDHFVEGACRDDPTATAVALVQHTERITDNGLEPSPDRTIVATTCGTAGSTRD